MLKAYKEKKPVAKIQATGLKNLKLMVANISNSCKLSVLTVHVVKYNPIGGLLGKEAKNNVTVHGLCRDAF